MTFAYTAKLFDDITELQNNLNRWYDPAVGRWMSEDPIGFEAGDPNLYRYVGNQPTTLVDPSGLHYVVGPRGRRLDPPLPRQLDDGEIARDVIDEFFGRPHVDVLCAPSDRPSIRPRPPGPDWKYAWPEPRNRWEAEIEFWNNLDDMNDVRESLEEYNRHRGNLWRQHIRDIYRTPGFR